jgi:hypothetical protein
MSLIIVSAAPGKKPVFDQRHFRHGRRELANRISASNRQGPPGFAENFAKKLLADCIRREDLLF